jgi:hypothetical protein
MDPERWKHVEALLHAALERPPETRDECVRRACGGDEAMGLEVRSLLVSQKQAGSFLENPEMEEARVRSLSTKTGNYSTTTHPSLVGRSPITESPNNWARAEWVAFAKLGIPDGTASWR